MTSCDTTTRIGDWIQTFSGGRWWPHSPVPDDVNEADFPALAQVIRFGGHCRLPDGRLAPYTVAQHSVHVFELVAEAGGTVDECRSALVHDLHEIYPPGDQLAPVLRLNCPATATIRALSLRASDALRKYLGVSLDLSSFVRVADMTMLATEARDLMAPVGEWRGLPPPREAKIEVWDHERAREEFMSYYRRLWPSGPRPMALR